MRNNEVASVFVCGGMAIHSLASLHLPIRDFSLVEE